jgi:hypothetical protein
MQHHAHRAEKDRVRAIDEEIKVLRADCNRQTDKMRTDIAKHRSDMLHFRGKYEKISGESPDAQMCGGVPIHGRDMLWARKHGKQFSSAL